MSHSTINAGVILETLKKDNCSVLSSHNIKQAIISTVKGDDEKVIFIRITPLNGSKSLINPIGYPIIEMQLYERFVREGKATIKLPQSSVQILINNSPPNDLKLFLTTLKVKSTVSSASIQELKKTNSLDRLRVNSICSLDVISPIRKSDAYKLQEKTLSKHFDNDKPITPVKKRLASINAESFVTPPNKKLKLHQYTSTPNANVKSLGLINPFDLSPSPTGKLLKSKSALNDSLNDSFQITENYKLTKEQIDIIERVKSGENVFYTGSAGTGKTYLLKRIIGTLPPQFTAVTASTGVAASMIEGCTLHSFAGIGATLKSISSSVEMINRKSQILTQWRKCKHLIIDEISLITAEYFDHLDQVIRVIRNAPHLPFGGIQMILSGDFFQLPPVMASNEKTNYKYVFQSRVWEDAFKEVLFLTSVKRQSDSVFIRLLSEIRMGRCPKWVDKKLRATADQKIEKDGIIPTQLCTHKVDVEEKNDSSIRSLPGESVVFDAVDSIPDKSSFISKGCQAEQKLTLKIGAQVMLIKNIDVQAGLANGARGVVVKFERKSENRYPIVKFICGQTCTIKPETFFPSFSIGSNKSLVTRRQLPLKLAYAISVHKSQGMTLDCVDLYLSKTFESGQAYVALSRCKSLDSMRVINFSNNCIRADNEVIKFYEQYQKDDESY